MRVEKIKKLINKKICECKSYFSEGVCPNCGLVDDEWLNTDDKELYDDIKSKKNQHGALRSNKVIDMSVMTYSNLIECKNPNLKRVLSNDGYFGWTVQSTKILINEIKHEII